MTTLVLKICFWFALAMVSLWALDFTLGWVNLPDTIAVAGGIGLTFGIFLFWTTVLMRAIKRLNDGLHNRGNS